MIKKKINEYLFMVSACVILVSTMFHMSMPEITNYSFAIAAAGYAVSRLSVRYEGDNLRLKRLFKIQKMPGLLLVFASYLMFKPGLLDEKNAWLIMVTIAAFIEVYSTFMIDAIIKRQGNK